MANGQLIGLPNWIKQKITKHSQDIDELNSKFVIIEDVLAPYSNNAWDIPVPNYHSDDYFVVGYSAEYTDKDGNKSWYNNVAGMLQVNHVGNHIYTYAFIDNFNNNKIRIMLAKVN